MCIRDRHHVVAYEDGIPASRLRHPLRIHVVAGDGGAGNVRQKVVEQDLRCEQGQERQEQRSSGHAEHIAEVGADGRQYVLCLLYTSDAADERSSVDLGGRRIIKKKKTIKRRSSAKMARKTRIQERL